MLDHDGNEERSPGITVAMISSSCQRVCPGNPVDFRINFVVHTKELSFTPIGQEY